MRSLTWEMDVREEGRVIGCEEGRREGIFDTLFALVGDGILNISEAAKRANVSEDEFRAKMENR